MTDKADMATFMADQVTGPAPPPILSATPPLAAATAGAAGPGPLSPEQLGQWAQANRSARKVLGAAKVATFNGWTLGLVAALCLPFAFFDTMSLVMGLGLGAAAWNEFRGRQLIRQFNLRGPRVLGWNQVALLGLLIGYCLWQIRVGLTGPNPYQEALQGTPELGPTLGSFDQFYKTMTLVVYGAILALSVVFQGFNALYYFRRTRLMQAYLAQTPAWILDIQRAGVS